MTPDTPDQEAFDQAHALWRQGRHDLAVPVLAELALRHPKHAGLHSALGVCRFESADYDGARIALEKALSLDPQQGIAAYNLAHLLLLLGDEERGFELYESRWSSFQRPSWHPSSDLAWDGAAFDGTLLVLAEQGFGDMIQFARFLPLAAQRCRDLVLVAPKELRRLLAQIPGVAGVVSAGEALPAFDRFVMMMSLPFRLGAFGSGKPTASYIPIPPNPPQLPGSGLRVGLVWAGRGSHAEDRLRSLAADDLRAILDVPGIDYFSLQIGSPPPPGVAGLAEGIEDFMDSAARIAALDLLISADTAPAHLGGAMGKPVWTLVTFVPDWRWGRAGDRTSWYPSMRLFRQESPQDWSLPLAKIRAALKELV